MSKRRLRNSFTLTLTLGPHGHDDTEELEGGFISCSPRTTKGSDRIGRDLPTATLAYYPPFAAMSGPPETEIEISSHHGWD